MILFLCLFATLFFAQVSNAEIYKTVDKQGRVVYTDQPSANSNAKIVELRSINSVPPTQFTSVESRTPDVAVIDINYQVTVISPVSGVMLLPDERHLTVSVSLDKALQPGHVLVYFLDGEIVEKTTELSITIVEPPRGEHKLHVHVMSKYGKSLGQSDAVTAVVMRPFIHKKLDHKKPDKVPKNNPSTKVVQ